MPNHDRKQTNKKSQKILSMIGYITEKRRKAKWRSFPARSAMRCTMTQITIDHHTPYEFLVQLTDTLEIYKVIVFTAK